MRLEHLRDVLKRQSEENTRLGKVVETLIVERDAARTRAVRLQEEAEGRMDVPSDTLLKISMVQQSIIAVRKLLEEDGEVIEGFHGTAEQLKAMLDSGELEERMLQEVVGEENLKAFREQAKKEETP